jgi:DNA-binding NarL/FixJ family response regulator
MTILIVEDNIFFRKALQTFVRSYFPSAEIRYAETAEQVLATLHPEPPDLIFMDIRIPGESGLKLTRKIKGAHPDVIIVINTSYDLPEYRQAAEDVGADHFIPKHAMGEKETRELVVDIRRQLQNT